MIDRVSVCIYEEEVVPSEGPVLLPCSGLTDRKKPSEAVKVKQMWCYILLNVLLPSRCDCAITVNKLNVVSAECQSLNVWWNVRRPAGPWTHRLSDSSWMNPTHRQSDTSLIGPGRPVHIRTCRIGAWRRLMSWESTSSFSKERWRHLLVFVTQHLRLTSWRFILSWTSWNYEASGRCCFCLCSQSVKIRLF